ncbi:MAG: DUF2254 domain-containing protein [bacterium]|nr:DUF2254 domain-containing protein [bacterium]
MKTKLIYWWDLLRGQLWFLPSIYGIVALIGVILLLEVDRSLQGSKVLWLGEIESTPQSARVVLGALISGLVTVLGLTFSLTMLSVSQTASQYGPRLVRSVFDSNVTQNVIGLYLGTVIFCMLVLRSIRDVEFDGLDFTPHVCLSIAELAGAVCLIALLALSNHVTRCMRAETLIHSIYTDLLGVTDSLYPEPRSDGVLEREQLVSEEGWKPLENAANIFSNSTGYLQAIDLDGLVRTAENSGQRVELLARPGDFVHRGTRIGLVEDAGKQVDDSDVAHYANYALTGTIRTPRQDLQAGLMELVEAIVRALSPGVNDPMTAINGLDYLGSVLRTIAGRKWPPNVIQDQAGLALVWVDRPEFREVLDDCYNQIRPYVGRSLAVMERMLDSLAAIAETAGDHDLAAIRNQAQLLMNQARRDFTEPSDLSAIEHRAEKLLK